jgi:hypothetical protein
MTKKGWQLPMMAGSENKRRSAESSNSSAECGFRALTGSFCVK